MSLQMLQSKKYLSKTDFETVKWKKNHNDFSIFPYFEIGNDSKYKAIKFECCINNTNNMWPSIIIVDDKFSEHKHTHCERYREKLELAQHCNPIFMRHKWFKSFIDNTVQQRVASIKESTMPKVIAWKQIKHSLFNKTKRLRLSWYLPRCSKNEYRPKEENSNNNNNQYIRIYIEWIFVEERYICWKWWPFNLTADSKVNINDPYVSDVNFMGDKRRHWKKQHKCEKNTILSHHMVEEKKKELLRMLASKCVSFSSVEWQTRWQVDIRNGQLIHIGVKSTFGQQPIDWLE